MVNHMAIISKIINTDISLLKSFMKQILEKSQKVDQWAQEFSI